jgi:xanthine dehydrogenase accessory factor
MATLVRTSGTTPRKEGTKMFVRDDGGIFGSVTIGGCVDARVIESSAEVLAATSPRLLNMQLGDEEAWEIGLTCGGSVDVFVEPLSESILEMYEAARREWDAGRGVALVTVISGPTAGARFLLGHAGEPLTPTLSPPDAGLDAGKGDSDELTREVARLLRGSGGSRTVSLGGREVYIEILRPPSRLLVFGAGAVAIPLVTFARELGFQTVVIDGRARFANRERFPDVDDLRLGIASEIAEQLEIGASTPVVLVAHDYKIDVPVLKKALAGETPYIGLLGSRRRGAAILELLREDGLPEEQLARIRVPVGLDLGGETAAEIALSIIAEVVAVMRGRSGGAMNARPPASTKAVLQRS